MLARLVQFSLTQRLLIVVISLGILLLGISRLMQLPIDAFPDISPTQVKVIIKAPGLTPEEVESRVTWPVEVELLGIPEQQTLRSVAKYGLTDITLDFNDGTDIYWARQQVAERLAAVWESLPEDVSGGIAPMSTPLGELFMFTLDGPYSLEQKRQLLDWKIRPVLRGVSGVADVNVLGGRVETFQVSPKPSAMQLLGVSYQDLEQALIENNSSDGAGRLDAGEETYLVNTGGRIHNLQQLRDLVVLEREGNAIRLTEIATVTLGSLTRYGSVTDSGKGEAVQALVVALRGANASEVIAGVRQALDTLKPALPADLDIRTFYDRSHLVDRAVSTVSTALMLAVVLVLILLGLFLGDVRAALAVAISLPMAAMVTFILMDQFNMSANLMSLGGLAIAIGMLVDASVVVVENCVARLATAPKALPRLHVLFRAVREVAGPVVSGTLIILLVFAPLMTLGGLEGKLFIPVALTIIFALAGSLVLSLTLIPVACTWLLNADSAKTPAWVEGLQRGYRAGLLKVMGRPQFILLPTAFALVLGIVAYTQVGKSFMPEMDEGDLILQIEKIPTISLNASQAVDNRVTAALVEQIPEIQRAIARSGADELGMDPMSLNETDIFLQLAPRDQWQLENKDALKDRIRTMMLDFPGINYAFTQPIDMRVSEMIIGSRGDVAVQIFGPELDVLQQLALQVGEILIPLQGSEDVVVQQSDGLHYLRLQPDQEEIGRRGLSLHQVQRQLRAALDGLQVGEIQREGEQAGIRSPLVIRYEKPEDWRSLLASQSLPDAQGNPVSLSELVMVEQSQGPVLIQREAGQRFGRVDIYVGDRALVDYVTDAQQQVEQQLVLPQGYYLQWGGEFENQQRASARLALMVPIAIALVFLVLFSTFGKASEALLVLGNIPLALIGGILALWASGIYLSVPASVGFIALLGVAVMNGVVLVDQFKQLQAQGTKGLDVIVEGAVRRLRPVLMTATTGAFGLLPLLFATGPGSEIQKPLAVVVTGGLVSSTLLTLFLLPLLYRKFIYKEIE